MRPAVFMKPPATVVHVRQAEAVDLAAINAVVSRAVMEWRLPERVKRLALPTYLYATADFAHLSLVVAEDESGAVLGVAAWEPANPRDLPAGQGGLLLHGLYVDPMHQHRGVGSRLLDAAVSAVRERKFDGLLVKAKADAVGFFEARGLRRLPVGDPVRDYPHRFWQAVRPRR